MCMLALMLYKTRVEEKYSVCVLDIGCVSAIREMAYMDGRVSKRNARLYIFFLFFPSVSIRLLEPGTQVQQF